MVGLFPRLRMGIDGEGVTKTGTYVSFACVLKIVDRSAAFPSCGTCSPKPLARETGRFMNLAT